jgi:hypothetical protein
MLSNKRHGIYPGSGRGGRTSSSGVLKALYCSAPGVPIVGLLQARRERKAGFQVPGVVTEMLWEDWRASAWRSSSPVVLCLSLYVVCLFSSVPHGRGVRPPFIDQGGGESHARRAI